ncbi:MAG TPA: uroporphyrinogen decarboxylase family protein [Bacteroidota bacterium]|nr:uroporphyrinogen decarboxylase family protein [Bacteroidota bacterium]
MTHRDRVLAAINHREGDRVPIDFGGHHSSGISAIAYARLRASLGLPARTVRVVEPIQEIALVDDDVLDFFGVDTIEMGRGFALRESDWSDWVLPDGTPCKLPAWVKPERESGRWIIRSGSGRIVGQMPDGALYFEQTYYPFAGGAADCSRIEESFADCMWGAIKSPPGPLASGPARSAILAAGARTLREKTDRAIVGLFGGNLLETGQMLYRNDNFLMLMAGDHGATHEFLDRLLELHLKNLEAFLGAVGPFIDVINFGDDLGMQTGPQMSPAMYREYFKPRHAAMWRRAKELADVKVMLHCCGGVRELLPDLIDAGLDIINPVQTSCRGMEPGTLKRDFGRDIVFWGGGCDTQSILPSGTPAGVARHVRERVKTMSPGGGFVFQQVHNILANVPPENVRAMFEAVLGS